MVPSINYWAVILATVSSMIVGSIVVREAGVRTLLDEGRGPRRAVDDEGRGFSTRHHGADHRGLAGVTT
jgi:hypothetical protein